MARRPARRGRELGAFRAELAAERALPPATLALLRECAAAGRRSDGRAAHRRRHDLARLGDDATAHRRAASRPSSPRTGGCGRGREPLAPRADLGHAANFLYMLSGDVPDAERVRGLETYLNTVVDHGLNASTFTARVITSTGSDLVSAVVGAIGALKGPLHGGAPGPALDMVFEIGDASRAEAVLRQKIEAGEKLMGFGHRVYKVRDPRADVLAAAAERMFTRARRHVALHAGARASKRTALRLLEEYKPGRRLQTNVEFYTALLLHGLGLEVPLFTPTFAISRVSGWIAHALEQRRANRIIRPQSEYVGPRETPLDSDRAALSFIASPPRPRWSQSRSLPSPQIRRQLAAAGQDLDDGALDQGRRRASSPRKSSIIAPASIVAMRIGDAAAGDVGRRAVHRLEHRRKRPRRIEVRARREPEAAGDRGAEVGQDVAEQVRGDDDVEVSRPADQIHARGVDEQRLGADVRILARDLGEHAVPERHAEALRVRLGHRRQEPLAVRGGARDRRRSGSPARSRAA